MKFTKNSVCECLARNNFSVSIKDQLNEAESEYKNIG